MSKKRENRKKRRLENEKSEKNKKFFKLFYLNKKVSETPLEMLEKFKKSWRFYFWKKKAKKICRKRKGNKKGCEKIPLAYAGRLDPMAEGKMLILAGEACKERERYLNLDKEYIFEILVGFESDTKDILGIVRRNENKNFYTNIWPNICIKRFLWKKEFRKKVLNILQKKVGKKEMEYPHFSSKTVGGKPLFLWALEKKIHEIKIPTKNIEIFSMNLEKIYFVKKKKMKNNIFSKINSLRKVEMESKKLGEDFRRVEVLKSWEDSLQESSSKHNFLILKIKTKVSSGTYMRNLAQEIGEDLGTTGLAYSIKRTRFFKFEKQ